jgi:hypothetical protein
MTDKPRSDDESSPRADAELAEAEELAGEAKAENPDPVTGRETFELDLMERHESKEGEKVELRPEGDE